MPRGRPAVPEIRYVAPTAKDRIAGAVVHCRTCKRDWPLALADKSRKLCLNHKRAVARKEMQLLRSLRDAMRPTVEEVARSGGACAVCAVAFPTGPQLKDAIDVGDVVALREEKGEPAIAIACRPCGQIAVGVDYSPERLKKLAAILEGQG